MEKLTILVSLPWLGALIILIGMKQEEQIKRMSLLTSVLTLWMSVKIWMDYDLSGTNFQMLTSMDWIPLAGGTFTLGIDGIGLNFILLSALLTPVCILASWDSIKYMIKEFYISMLLIEGMLMLVFTVLDVISFYIFFESVLIPMFVLIGVWGSRSQKVQAAYYFFLYTLVGSVLMLLGIFVLYYNVGTTDYQVLLATAGLTLDETTQIWLFLAFYASLAVKIPKVPFHIWLPQAHVEAPMAGSVFLAGVLLKLGAYGFIRFSLPLFPYASVYFSPLIFTFSVIGVIYASLTTLRQIDLKRIIAYSSVSHMGLVTLSLFTCSIQGLEASIFLMVAHGITSSALFICVTLLYERTHTRILKYYRGIAAVMPIFSLTFLLFSLANLGLPLTANFIGEFLSLLAIFQYNPFIALLATTGVIFSAAYSLFLYNRVSFGSLSPYLSSVLLRDVSRREFYALLPLIFSVILLGVYPDLILNSLHSSCLLILTYF